MEDEDVTNSSQHWTDEIVTARHRCPQDDHLDVGILRRESCAPLPDAWILANMESATEEDVRSGRACVLAMWKGARQFRSSFAPFAVRR